ncbi:MAG: pitrilysin family protein [Bacteroidia bacterium]|nr:insulinase family protein [Bacteroidia bacterium]MDW8158311.1 pitrilysin family protein [Bacteroidia bacterium]
MLIDRKQAPLVAPLSVPPLPQFQKIELSNGIPLYVIPFGKQPVAELQVVFNIGHCYENLHGLAAFTSQMTREGVEGMTAFEIEEQLDWHGSSLGIDSGYEITTFTLSTPLRHLNAMVHLLGKILFLPTFPEREFELHKKRTLQALQVQEQKTSWQAKHLFYQNLFGPTHPYGVRITKENIEKITLETVKEYHARYMLGGIRMLFLAGQFEVSTAINTLEEVFGKANLHSLEPVTMEINTQPGKYVHFMPEHLQSTICVGHLAFERNHPDYHKMRFVTTILGGYFGSLLMKSIREAKGFTYGIHASWACRKRGGYFIIKTDVANVYVDPTLEEIHHQIQRMQNSFLSEEEITIAKNYTLGRYIDSQETPFQVADLIKNIVLNELPIEDIQQGFMQIQSTTAQEIQTLSQKYFHPEKFITVVAGNYAS